VFRVECSGFRVEVLPGHGSEARSCTRVETGEGCGD
jgi:hypothetical protein